MQGGAPHAPKYLDQFLTVLLVTFKTMETRVATLCFNQLSQKHRVATLCFDCLTKMSPVVKVASKTIKN